MWDFGWLPIQLLMRWLHLGGIAIVVGGMVFWRLALLPALDPIRGAAEGGVVVRRFAPILRGAIYAIIVSGLYQVFHLTPRVPASVHQIYVTLLLTKLTLATVALTAAYRSVIDRSKDAFFSWRRPLTLNLILVGLIIAIAAYLRMLRP